MTSKAGLPLWAALLLFAKIQKNSHNTNDLSKYKLEYNYS